MADVWLKWKIADCKKEKETNLVLLKKNIMNYRTTLQNLALFLGRAIVKTMNELMIARIRRTKSSEGIWISLNV